MKKLLKKIRSEMAVNVIGAIIILLAVFGVIVGTIGILNLSDVVKKEYAETTYRMADTATTLVNGSNLEKYLAGEETEEYRKTKTDLNIYCKKMNVSMIYVIMVDKSDYGRFVSIFNPVNNAVDNSSYTEWELGHKRDTTNDEYRQKYKALYDNEAPYETVYRKAPTDGQHPHITTMVPVRNSAGTVTAILCMQRPIHELEEIGRPYLVKIGILTFLLCVFSAVIAAFFLKKQLVEPIRKVSAEAVRFAKENTKGEPLAAISRYEEISSLASSIDTMETDMVNYVENMTLITAEKERIGAELSFARNIQEDSIPNIFPAFPEREDIDIFASMTPAKEVGGDFYNFFLLDEDHLVLFIGDVSGKGIPGALFMMVTNIVISNRARMGGTPAEILDFVNNNICDQNKADMFVTVWLGILEISTGRIISANAGHEDAVICRENGSFEFFKTKHDIVIGAFEGIRYKDFEFRLEKGDKLFIFTDGVTEATDQGGELFGMDRMIDALNEYRDKTPHEILDGVHLHLNEFTGDAPQFDDVTMLCLELKKNDNKPE